MGSQRVGHDWVTSLSLLLEHSGIVIQSLSHVQLYETTWTTASQSSLSFTISRRLLKLMSIELVMSPNHLVLCCPLLLSLSIFPSIRVFTNELALCIRRPKYWSFGTSPSNEYSGLISFIFIYFFKFYFIFQLYIIVLVLPNIKMNPPQVYMCSLVNDQP